MVYTVLEAQYQSSLSAAVRNINEKRTDVCYEACRPSSLSTLLPL